MREPFRNEASVVFTATEWMRSQSCYPRVFHDARSHVTHAHPQKAASTGWMPPSSRFLGPSRGGYLIVCKRLLHWLGSWNHFLRVKCRHNPHVPLYQLCTMTAPGCRWLWVGVQFRFASQFQPMTSLLSLKHTFAPLIQMYKFLRD